MKVLFCILDDVEKLDDVLTEMNKGGISEATILTGRGMHRELSSKYDEDEFEFLGSSKQYHKLKEQKEERSVIMSLLQDEQVDGVIEIIERIAGDLSQPDTGIVFTMPVDFAKGIREYGK